MRLFYFTPPNFLRENLQEKKVKVSRFGDYGSINDPFELAAYDISDPEFRTAHRAVTDDFCKKLGFVCFSERMSSPVMWAHYADNHRGVCLEFDVTAENIFKVTYKSRKLFKGISLETYRNHVNHGNIREVYGTKAKDWAYEKEWRLLVGLQGSSCIREERNGQELHFVPIDSSVMKLKKIHVGFRCSLGINEIEKDIFKYQNSVDVVQVRPAFSKFKVVPQRDQKFWNFAPSDEQNEGALPAVRAVFGS